MIHIKSLNVIWIVETANGFRHEAIIAIAMSQQRLRTMNGNLFVTRKS